jgi:hypothetical protein
VIFLVSARLVTPRGEHVKRVQSKSPPPFIWGRIHTSGAEGAAS